MSNICFHMLNHFIRSRYVGGPIFSNNKCHQKWKKKNLIKIQSTAGRNSRYLHRRLQVDYQTSVNGRQGLSLQKGRGAQVRPVRVGTENQTQGGSQGVKLEESGKHRTKQEVKTRRREALDANMEHSSPQAVWCDKTRRDSKKTCMMKSEINWLNQTNWAEQDKVVKNNTGEKKNKKTKTEMA